MVIRVQIAGGGGGGGRAKKIGGSNKSSVKIKIQRIGNSGVKKKGGGGRGGGRGNAAEVSASQALSALAGTMGTSVKYEMPGDSPPFEATAVIGKLRFQTKKSFASKQLAIVAAAEVAVAQLKKKGAGKKKKGVVAKKGAKGADKAGKKDNQPVTAESLDTDMQAYFDTPETIAARKAEQAAAKEAAKEAAFAEKKLALDDDMDSYFTEEEEATATAEEAA